MSVFGKAPKRMVDHLLFLLLLLGGTQVVWACPCNGVLIAGSDQVHCWEVISGGGSGGWVSADVACQSIGGHLGHLNTDLPELRSYLETVYTRPILTGIVVGNSETDRYALVCPDNVYYGLLNGTMFSSLLAQNATPSSNCGFVTNADYKVHFAPCSTPADALCDRPVEKEDYCGIQMNCSTTTTLTVPSTTTPRSSKVTTTLATSTTTTIVVNTTTSSPSSITSPTTTETSTKSAPIPSSTPSTPPPPTATSKMSSTTTLAALLSSTAPPPSNIQPLPTCPSIENCDWKIFGSCAPWFPWLLLALLLLALLLLLCCCCQLCKEKRTEQVVVQPEEYRQHENVGPSSRPLTVSSTSAGRSVVSYSPEPTMPNPPVVVDSTPVVMIPMFPPPPRTEIIEKLTKEYTKEIHVLEKEKVVMKEIGVNTDPWTPILEVKPKKQKKAAPAPIEIHDDIADDISIKMPDSPGIDETPDFPDEDDDQYNFVRNPKPENFGDEPLGDVPPTGGLREPRSRDPATVINLTADPRNIRSPPTKQRNVHLPTEDPHVKSFSPISDVSEADGSPPGPVAGRKHRFPSPPAYRPRIPEQIPEKMTPQNRGAVEEPTASNNGPKPERLSNSAPGDDSGNHNLGVPSRNNNRGRSPSRSMGGNDNHGRSPAPDFNNGNGITPTSLPGSKSPAPLMRQADVSIRAANGRLGGVVRAGGGPDDQAPQGWKPWAKTSKSSQPHND